MTVNRRHELKVRMVQVVINICFKQKDEFTISIAAIFSLLDARDNNKFVSIFRCNNYNYCGCRNVCEGKQRNIFVEMMFSN